VANNTYDEQDYHGTMHGGRLAEWDGRSEWNVLEKTAFNEVAAVRAGEAMYATGWDKCSAILKVYVNGEWSTYRLPKATQAMDHMILTEWPRIREVETERFLLDCHGIFYEMSHLAYGGKVWGIRPISTHLRMIPETGFEHKVIHLCNDSVQPVRFTVEVDFLGDGTWKTYDAFEIAGSGYVHHEFAAGFSAHWIRITANSDCKATAYLIYA